MLSQGVEQAWFMWPGLVRLTVSNLIANAKDAYRRRANPISTAPVWFDIDYTARLVVCRDEAGGVKQGLEHMLFEPYVSEKGVFMNVGLGLPQARMAMHVQGFDLYLAPNQPSHGAAFLLDFRDHK